MSEGRIVMHEFLLKEDYYETRSVKRGRTQKRCEHCGQVIPKGSPSDVHHFYPEFESYPTHPACSEKFLASLRSEANNDEEE
jgi:hypothetical protein